MLLLEYAETVPLTRNLSKEVKNTRIILWVVDIYPIRLKYNLTKLKRSQEGTASLQKHGIGRSFFHLLQILIHIYPTSTKLLVTIAILSIIHPNYHRFFLRVPLSHLLEGPKNIKEPLAGPKGSNYTNCYDPLPSGFFKCISKCDLSKNYLRESKIFLRSSTERFYNIRQHVDCKSRNVIYLVTC